MNKKLATCFISYSRRESSIFVEELISSLPEITFWVDKSIVPGTTWKIELVDAIRNNDVFLYIASDSSMKSIYCELELLNAISNSKPVIPVIGECVDISQHEILQSIQGVVLENDQEKDSAKIKKAILDAVKIRVDSIISKLIIFEDAKFKNTIILNGNKVSIGRNPQYTPCSSLIKVGDKYTSKHHLDIIKISNRWILENKSLNGTYVNHKTCEAKVLINNDVIHISKNIYLKYQEESISDILIDYDSTVSSHSFDECS
ncbi:MAG: TIR domain-containing protein [Moorea sp. SIO3E2]|nr:TIR domain-containing protein [Moorena sp. SIO3E2]